MTLRTEFSSDDFISLLYTRIQLSFYDLLNNIIRSGSIKKSNNKLVSDSHLLNASSEKTGEVLKGRRSIYLHSSGGTPEYVE